jgi:hypothetical protein
MSEVAAGGSGEPGEAQVLRKIAWRLVPLMGLL